jgi:hypothetical protein
MRSGRDQEILETEGKLIGVNLGADYCAEHEWGIKGIKSRLGIDDSKQGLSKRIISSTHKDLTWLENVSFDKKSKSKWSGIWLGSIYNNEPYFDRGASFAKAIYSQWDESGFCVLSNDATTLAKLKTIYQAFETKDIAIWLGGGGVFQNAGLCIAIASHLPKDVTDKWLTTDVDNEQIKKEFAATGIEEKLKKAGKGYFALSPRRDKDGSLMYWLNPMEQKQNNCGWFKLNELEAWAKNEGPIPMKKK